MKILVLGGTRYVGVRLVNTLLSGGHDVTVATRGKTPDSFGGRVKRKVINREDPDSIAAALANEAFDVAFDSLAYSSKEVRYLLDVLRADRYIMTSTVSVYDDFHQGMREEEMDTRRYPLKWCGRADFAYDEIKRQAECALFQAYPGQNAAAPRFPYIFGSDDYTRRLYFYIDHIINGLPMRVDNPEARLSFIGSAEASAFLAWLADSPLCGSVNACSGGGISLGEVISYAEKRSGKRALMQETGDAAPLNGVPGFSPDTSKAADAGFMFMDLSEWIYPLIDAWIPA